MKKIKKIIAILSLAMMLGITTIPNYAYAMPSEENAAIDTVAAYVKENAEEFSDERTPIETIYFAIDKNGEMTIISGETETYKLVEDVIVGGYKFFDDGLKGVDHYYEVQMTATVIDKSDYFTYHSLSVKPKNNSSYLSAVSASHASYLRKTTVSDAKQYYYAGSTPNNPYVYVKSSFSVNGDTSYSIPEKKLTNPIK